MCLGKKVIVYNESYDTYIYQKKVQKDPIKRKAKIYFFNKAKMANISISVTLEASHKANELYKFIKCHTYDGMLFPRCFHLENIT